MTKAMLNSALFVWIQMCQRTGARAWPAIGPTSARLNFELRGPSWKSGGEVDPGRTVHIEPMRSGRRNRQNDKSGRRETLRRTGPPKETGREAAQRIGFDLGFAQACVEIASAQDDRAEKYKWYRKAADLGSAEGRAATSDSIWCSGAGVEERMRRRRARKSAAAPPRGARREGHDQLGGVLRSGVAE